MAVHELTPPMRSATSSKRASPDSPGSHAISSCARHVWATERHSAIHVANGRQDDTPRRCDGRCRAGRGDAQAQEELGARRPLATNGEVGNDVRDESRDDEREARARGVDPLVERQNNPLLSFVELLERVLRSGLTATA
jgi:hypothetical protein